MTPSTSELLKSLAADATPVRRLRAPWLRSLLWLSGMAGIALLLALVHGLRPDLGERLHDPGFLFQIGASLVTGITAAVAAFYVSLPDRSAAWLLLPVPSLLLWISGMGYGCLTNWIALVQGVPLPHDRIHCLMMIVFMSLPLSAALVVMLRHAGPLRPTLTAGAGALAVAGLVATALTFAEAIDGTLIVLIWNAGALALVLAGRRRLGLSAATFR